MKFESKIAITFLLCFSFSKANSKEIEKVKITCDKTLIEYWPLVGDVLICYTAIGTKVLTPNAVVDSGSKNESIEAIEFQSPSEVHYMPKGLKENFPKLKMIHFSDQPLATLNENDLKQFGGDLECFNVKNCKLAALPESLFRYNPNLKHLNIAGNPLKYIEPGFFENISKMKQLGRIFVGNSACIDQEEIKPNIQKATWTHTCNDQSVM